MSIYIYNSNEIKKIAHSCQITANILDEIGLIIEEGISTVEINKLAEDLCKKYKVKPAFLGYQGFPGVLCISLNEEVIHGIPGKRKLETGDIVGIDFGIVTDGYFGDSARTFSVGKISDEAENLLKVTKDSLYKAIEKAVVGNRISDVSYEVEHHVNKFGYKPVRSFTGHGIGKNLHEEPSVPNYGKAGRGPRIKNGMVFAIEPMINQGTHEVRVLNDDWTVVTTDNKLSAHFEHTIAIINEKAEILTKGRNFN